MPPQATMDPPTTEQKTDKEPAAPAPSPAPAGPVGPPSPTAAKPAAKMPIWKWVVGAVILIAVAALIYYVFYHKSGSTTY